MFFKCGIVPARDAKRRALAARPIFSAKTLVVDRGNKVRA
jgi:hypothetical protein